MQYCSVALAYKYCPPHVGNVPVWYRFHLMFQRDVQPYKPTTHPSYRHLHKL